MITIEFRFLANRYHATPHGHEPNEGLVEWPPSPWRIARALLATWHLKAPELSSETVLSVVTKLASSPPQFRVPKATASHTRHYMPRLDKIGTRLVFDGFLSITPNDTLIAQWPQLELAQDEVDSLDVLLERLAYLGRAESWVGARRCEPISDPNALVDHGQSGEQVRLLALSPLTELDETLASLREVVQGNLLAAKQMKAAKDGKKIPSALPKKDIATSNAKVPGNAREVLEQDLGILHKQGWTAAPGTCWLTYRRPAITITSSPSIKPSSSTKPTVARFAIASQVVPRFTDALYIGERIHRALTKRSNAESAIIRGTRQDGKALRAHQHASIMFETDGKGGIGSFVVYAPAGFDAPAIQALQGLQTIWMRNGHPLQVVPIVLGQSYDLDATGAGASKLFGASKRWRSLTPFVGTRHPKTNKRGVPRLDPKSSIVLDGETTLLQKDGPLHDLLRLIQASELPRPTQVSWLQDCKIDGRTQRWEHFGTRRHFGGGKRGPVRPMAFELEFKEELHGPLAFGYGAHYGLGVFEPVSF